MAQHLEGTRTHLSGLLAAGLFAALLGLSGCGEKKEAASEPASTGEAPAAKAGPAMWTLRDADSTITLFGTFHLLPPGLDWQSDRLTAALNEASLVMFEADIEGTDSTDLIRLIETHGVSPPGVKLRARMKTPDEVTKFEALASSLGRSADELDLFQPWYAATVLTVDFAARQGFTSADGAEAVLFARAKEQGKSLAFFETLEQQILFFARLPEDTQMKMLSATVDEIETSAGLLKDMQAAWLTGDTATMANLFDTSIRAVPDLNQVLITERNEAWVGELERLLAGSGNAFVAVGAGHLVGTDSVVTLLRAKGHTVEGP